MTLKNPAERWGPVSLWLHWTMFVLIAAIAVLGLYMADLPNNPQKIKFYSLHKSLGLTLLGLVVVRLAWRALAGAPHRVPGTPVWQGRIAMLTHAAMYVLMFALPLTGWLLNSAAGYPLQWFGLFNLPRIAATNEDLRELAESLHESGFWFLLALVIAHAAAAFYHHVFQHDATLTRMLPQRRARAPAPPETGHVV